MFCMRFIIMVYTLLLFYELCADKIKKKQRSIVHPLLILEWELAYFDSYGSMCKERMLSQVIQLVLSLPIALSVRYRWPAYKDCCVVLVNGGECLVVV